MSAAGLTKAGVYTIDIAAGANIELTSALEAINLKSGVTLDIDGLGAGATLDGANASGCLRQPARPVRLFGRGGDQQSDHREHEGDRRRRRWRRRRRRGTGRRVVRRRLRRSRPGSHAQRDARRCDFLRRQRDRRRRRRPARPTAAAAALGGAGGPGAAAAVAGAGAFGGVFRPEAARAAEADRPRRGACGDRRRDLADDWRGRRRRQRRRRRRRSICRWRRDWRRPTNGSRRRRRGVDGVAGGRQSTAWRNGRLWRRRWRRARGENAAARPSRSSDSPRRRGRFWRRRRRRGSATGAAVGGFGGGGGGTLERRAGAALGGGGGERRARRRRRRPRRGRRYFRAKRRVADDRRRVPCGRRRHAGAGAGGGSSGDALGSGIFLQGDENITFDPAAGNYEDISDVIAAQHRRTAANRPVSRSMASERFSSRRSTRFRRRDHRLRHAGDRRQRFGRAPAPSCSPAAAATLQIDAAAAQRRLSTIVLTDLRSETIRPRGLAAPRGPRLASSVRPCRSSNGGSRKTSNSPTPPRPASKLAATSRAASC